MATATTGALEFSTTATASSPLGFYAIEGSGLTAKSGNYIFVEAPGDLTALTIASYPFGASPSQFVPADFRDANDEPVWDHDWPPTFLPGAIAAAFQNNGRVVLFGPVLSETLVDFPFEPKTEFEQRTAKCSANSLATQPQDACR